MNNFLSCPEAGPIRRVLALAYDTLMVVAISLVYVLLVSIADIAFTSLQVGDAVEVYHQWWYRLGFIIVNATFFIYFWRHGGQTIGMRAWRLQLMDVASGNAPSLRQCGLRCLITPFCIAAGLVGYWWCWFDQDGRALQDRWTNTRVALLPKTASKNSEKNKAKY